MGERDAFQFWSILLEQVIHKAIAVDYEHSVFRIIINSDTYMFLMKFTEYFGLPVLDLKLRQLLKPKFSYNCVILIFIFIFAQYIINRGSEFVLVTNYTIQA